MLSIRERGRLSIYILILAGLVLFYRGDIDSSFRKSKSVPKAVKVLVKRTKVKPHQLPLSVVVYGAVAFFFKRRSTSYELSPSQLTIRRGVFMRNTDTIEMSKVQDLKITTNPLIAILGLSNVTIYSPRDVTDQKFRMLNLRTSDAEAVRIHIAQHAVSSITELMKAKEAKVESEKQS